MKFGFENLVCRRDHTCNDVFICERLGGFQQRLQHHFNRPFVAQRLLQRRQIPLFLNAFKRHILVYQICEAAFPQRRDLPLQIRRVKYVVALLVNHLALVVRYIVVLQQLLANVKVTGLHFALGGFDAAGHDAGFNGLALRHFQAIHDGAHAVTRKNAHQ